MLLGLLGAPWVPLLPPPSWLPGFPGLNGSPRVFWLPWLLLVPPGSLAPLAPSGSSLPGSPGFPGSPGSSWGAKSKSAYKGLHEAFDVDLWAASIHEY